MKKLLTFLMLSILVCGVGWAEDVTDVLDQSLTGVTGTVYSEWSDKTANSSAVYAGQSAGGNSSIQLRSNNNNSGIVTTESGGKVKSITLEFNSATASGRTVDVYGKNTAYSAATDLYNSSTRGTKLGSIVNGTSTSLTIDGDYTFIGLRSNSGAVYLTSVTIVWEKQETPTISTPVISGTTPFEGSTEVSIACATEGATIYYTTNGDDPTNASTEYTAPFTITQSTTVKAIAYDASGASSSIATMDFAAMPQITSVAEFNALPDGTSFRYVGYTLHAIVQFVNNNNKYLYAQDGDKGMLIYGDTGQTYNMGQQIYNFTGTKTTYSSAPEVINPGEFKESTSTQEMIPLELTPSQLSLDDFGRYVVIRGATFNTTDKKIVVGDEEVDYYNYTTLMSDIPTDGGTYDIYGVIGAHNNNVQFLPFKYEVPVVPEVVDYYLIGSFNGWSQDTKIAFEKLNDNTYVIDSQYMDANTEFKIYTKDGRWLGGSDGDTYNVSPHWFRNMPLEQGKEMNFKLTANGSYLFIIKIDDAGVPTLFVPQFTGLGLTGTFNNWSVSTTSTDRLIAFVGGLIDTDEGARTCGPITLTEDSEFKIYDFNGQYYGGNDAEVSGDEAVIELMDGNNIKIPAGMWTFSVDITKTYLTVKAAYLAHEIMVDAHMTNGKVEADKTSATKGETVTLTVTPDPGYELESLVVKTDATDTPVPIENNQFIMPDDNVSIYAEFKKESYVYRLVTSDDEITSGDYLIVYEGNDTNLAFDGSLTTLDAVGNGIEVTITDNIIQGTDEINAAIFTYDAAAGSLKSKSGYYIGNTSDANALKTSTSEAYVNTITLDSDGNADIVSSSSRLRYNSTSNQTRFRYYKSTSYTGQKPVRLYKRWQSTQIVATPAITGETSFVESTEVTITCATEGASIYYTTNGDDPTNESTLYSEPFTISETTTVKAIAYDEAGTASAIATKEFVKLPSVATIAEYKELADGTDFAFTGNVTVTYVNGRNIYVKDETGAALIYGDYGTTFDFERGQVLKGGWTATTKYYYGLLEAQTPDGLEATDETVEVVPTEMNLSKISSDNDNEYIIIKKVNITGVDSKKNFTITDAQENTITGRTYFSDVTHPNDTSALYNITCLVGEYNGTIQLYPTAYEALAPEYELEGVSFGEGRQWATWFGNTSLALPQGVKAYVVTGVTNDAVTVSEIDYIPGFVGVLLYSEETAENLTTVAAEEGDTQVTSLLEGNIDPVAIREGYVLYNNEFVAVQGGTTLGAHRCYLPAGAVKSQAAPRLKIAVGGNAVTGVEDLRVVDGETTRYYDLNGRYLGTDFNALRGGIYVTGNGKKVVK